MPVYVTDPENSEAKIDVLELKRRYPTKDLEPFLIDEYLKQDLWSMKEAVLLLAGYDLKTECTLKDNKFSPTGIGRVFYLDGLSSHCLNDNGLANTLCYQCFDAYLKLIEHTRHYDIHAEKKHPKDWIKWAIDKDLKPYWLDFNSDNSFNQGVTISLIKRKLGSNVFKVNWEHYLSLDKWTPEQAICLLHEIDYDKMGDDNCKKYFLDLLQIAKVKGDLIPYEWVEFAKKNELDIPDKLQGIKCIEQKQTEAVEDVGLVSHAETETKPKALSKMEKQQAAILEVIKAKRFKPMAIPDGEKGTIKSICEIDYKDDLFKAGTAFDAAWKKGIGKLWQMEHHESYAHRGNN